MGRARKNSSLLSKYSLMYEKNPRSRVFAPLAETYRKLGMIDNSIKILQQGIRVHPTYTLAYVVLAHCYYDLQNFEMSYNTIRSFVSTNLENLTMQKLFAKTCMKLGYLDEALSTYKNLLFLNPRDLYVAEQVKLLEDDLMVPDSEDFEISAQNTQTSFEEDNWIQVDFNQTDVLELQGNQTSPTDPLEKFKKEVSQERLDVDRKNLDDVYFHEEYDTEGLEVMAPDLTERPIITHTLVDLYCSQGHMDKAIEVLQDILALHPDDNPSKEKLAQIKEMLERDSVVAETDRRFQYLEMVFNKYLDVIKAKSKSVAVG